MNIGKLRNRISIIRPPTPEDVDEAGQPLDDWQPVATVWAAIEPLYGRELFAAMQVNAEVTTRIRIRYREGIDRTMAARIKGSEFEFLYVIEPEFAEKELQIMCRGRQ
ncbi:phage head closure protein [Sporosarcina sp. FSL K6-3457]|uniref:phage head closure protein n=1 Tax=Sporosarcina sp. FSL K6-3457 TaxID=2978204 RepID=UPI0030F53AC7